MKTEIKSVREVFELFKDKVFDIPPYQRGYRWGESEVTTMIDDIMEFNPSDKKEKYCLQPIVVQEEYGSEYVRIVDGQQRLTTISLFKEFFSAESGDLLPTCCSRLISENNEDRNVIDRAYLNGARKAISIRLNGLDTGTLRDKLDGNCVFILCWLEDENAEEVFERLNVGKIPLSSAEILKAYYVTEFPQECEKHDFINRWNLIEETLQDDNFYYFFSHDEGKNERYYSTRMDFILEVWAIREGIVKNADGITNSYKSSPVFLFNEIKEMDLSDFINGVWNLFNLMNEIYEDTTLYNLFGFLSCCNDGNHHILHVYKGLELSNIKSMAIGKLNLSPAENVDIEALNKKLDGLSYFEQLGEIRDYLLFHNAIKSSNFGIRFDYNEYRTGYDLEHIHARQEVKEKDKALKILESLVAEKEKYLNRFPNGEGDFKEFFSDLSKFIFETNKNKNFAADELEAWDSCRWALESEDGMIIRESSKDKVFEWTARIADEDSDEWRYRSIKNLCLLSHHINRSIGNHPYPVKKGLIAKKFTEGHQLTVVTAEIFSVLKDNPYQGKSEKNREEWNLEMGTAYMKAIANDIREFVER